MLRPGSTRVLFGALALLLFLIPTVRAAEEPPQPSTPHVVIVGISNYADKQIKARDHAEDDARALYDLFTGKDHLGADRKNVRLLLGKPSKERDSKPATRKNILEALDWLTAESKRDDLTLFLFIGEGGPLGAQSDRRCFFASDSRFKDRNKTAIATAEIGERLQKLKSRHFCAFLDVNFRGFTDATVAETKLGSSPYREFLGDDGTDEHNFMPGRVVFLATNGLSGSLDLKEHGLFSHVLLEALQGKADRDGYEPDGLVTVEELTEYLNKEMPKLAQKFGKTEEQKGQVHFILGDRTNATPLSTNPAVMGKVRKRIEKLDKLIADKKLPENLGVEGKALLRQMPKLKSQQELRKAYQGLVDGTLTMEKFEDRRDEILATVKLERSVAAKFASKVLEGADLLLEDYVKKVSRGELVNYAIRGLYRKLDAKLPEAIAKQLAKPKDLNERELRKLLIDARMHLGKREDLTDQKDVNIALQRMVGGLRDAYSSFIDPETLEQFQKGTEGRFVGIGVQIRKDRATDQLLVVTPLKGSPAYKAGVRAGDLITTITRTVDAEGKKLDKPDVIPTRGLSVGDAVTRIKGKPGSKVRLTIRRPGEEKPIEVEVERNRIELETVMGYQRKGGDKWDFMADPAGKIGYIRLTQFTDYTAEETELAVKLLKKQGMKALVLDMRFNPGGLLDVARRVSDLFVDDGLIVSIRPRQGQERRLMGFSEGSELNFPMVVLVNGSSASGSEVVAACLQDHARAIIGGERSYGKGSVQDVRNFAGGKIKYTTATFWPPSGRNLNKASTKGRDEDDWGVKPTRGYELKLSLKETEDLEEFMQESEIILPEGKSRKRANPEFRDRQLEHSLKYLREQVKLADKVKGKLDE